MKNWKNLNWKILFDALLTQEKITDFEVTDKEIILRTDENNSQKVIDKLKQIFYSPASFEQALPYTIKSSHNTQPLQSSQLINLENIKPVADTVADVKKILLNLFGEKAFKTIALNIDDLFDEEARVENGVLFSKPTKQKIVATMWNAALEYLLLYFKDASLDDIRHAWLGKQNLTAPKDDLSNTKSFEVARGLVQQCFGVVTKEQPMQVDLYFNYAKLFEFLFPPYVASQQLENVCEIRMQIRHLLSYLQQLTHDGTLFRMYKNNLEATEFFVRPIFFGSKSAIEKPRLHILVIDRSGSMEPYFADLKKHVLEYAEELRKLESESKVEVVFFDEKTDDPKEFNLTNEKEITGYINDKKIGSSTRLYGTVVDQLRRIIEGKLTQQYNVNMLLFTDGNDTVDTELSKKMPLVNGKLLEFSQQNLELPKIFTLGFGNCDKDVLATLAIAMGNPYIQLESINDFRKILDYVGEINTQRQLVKFLYDLHGTTHKFNIPVYHNNSPQLPDIIIPLQENKPLKVEVDDNAIEVTVFDAKKIPLANFNDKLANIVYQANDIIFNDSTLMSGKEQKLQTLLNEVNNFVATSPSEKQNMVEVKEYLQTNLNGLREAIKTNQYESYKTVIASNRGFISQMNAKSPQKPMEPETSKIQFSAKRGFYN